MASSEFFSTLSKFVKEFADSKAAVERVRRQEEKALAVAAAKEKKLNQQLQLEQQKEVDGDDNNNDDNVNDGGDNVDKPEKNKKKKESLVARQQELEQKENAMMAVAGIVIPKKIRKTRSQSQSMKLKPGQLEDLLRSKNALEESANLPENDEFLNVVDDSCI